MRDKFILRVKCGRDLVAKDSNGYSDPYIYVKLAQEGRSKIKKKGNVNKRTLNPVINELYTFEVGPEAVIFVQVWDHDFLSKDDFMGEITIRIRDLVGKPLNDQFIELKPRMGKKDRVKGGLVVSARYGEAQAPKLTAQKSATPNCAAFRSVFAGKGSTRAQHSAIDDAHKHKPLPKPTASSSSNPYAPKGASTSQPSNSAGTVDAWGRASAQRDNSRAQHANDIPQKQTQRTDVDEWGRSSKGAVPLNDPTSAKRRNVGFNMPPPPLTPSKSETHLPVITAMKSMAPQKSVAAFDHIQHDLFATIAAKLPIEVQAQIREYEKTGKKFTDSKFPPTDSSLYLDPRRPPNTGVKVTQWRRVSELAKRPQLFVDGVEPGDVVQGGLGDCWLLGAVSMVSTQPKLLRNIFNSTKFTPAGIYSMRFYSNGQWVDIVVDDYIPCDASGRPVYARCADDDELWVMLFEKAFAKLYGCYEALTAGNESAAFYDLTGYPPLEILLRHKETQKSLRDGTLFKQMLESVRGGNLLGCASRHPDNVDMKGILTHHAYAILNIVETHGLRLVQIRNPWGFGEWQGDYSDNSSKWTSQLSRELKLIKEDDGTFWMTWDDFVTYYDEIFVCQLFPNNWHKVHLRGEWSRETAGGSSQTTQWRKNPQYKLTVHKTGPLYIMLSQPDRRSKKLRMSGQSTEYPFIGVYVISVPNGQRATAMTNDNIEFGHRFVSGREMSVELPEIAPGDYAVIPATSKPGLVMPFELMVYSDSKFEWGEFPEKKASVTQVLGHWSGVSSGGCRNYSTWRHNPQYSFMVPRTEQVTVTLSSDVDEHREPIGFYVLHVPDQADPSLHRLVINGDSAVSMRSEFSASNEVSCAETLTGGQHYVVVPSTFNPSKHRKNFTIEVMGGNPIKVVDLGTVTDRRTGWNVLEYKGEWNGRNAGGCTNHQTWLNNPTFPLSVKTRSRVSVVVTQPLGTGADPYANMRSFGVFICKAPISFAGIVKNSPFIIDHESAVECELEAGEYVVIPCTFRPNETGKFGIVAYVHSI